MIKLESCHRNKIDWKRRLSKWKLPHQRGPSWFTARKSCDLIETEPLHSRPMNQRTPPHLDHFEIIQEWRNDFAGYCCMRQSTNWLWVATWGNNHDKLFPRISMVSIGPSPLVVLTKNDVYWQCEYWAVVWAHLASTPAFLANGHWWSWMMMMPLTVAQTLIAQLMFGWR